MTCPACEAVAANPKSGKCRMQCLHCCARLLASTRPQSPQAAAMLALIARCIKRYASTFGLGDVKESARLLRAKRRSVPPKSPLLSSTD